MFKYRVLTFTIILSMLLFYVTPIGNINVKANEVEYTQQQLQDVGAWFIGERLLEGAIENFNFSNLPTGVTADDFLADLGAIVVDGNPDPLLDDLGQVADDIWNSIELELNSWSAEDAWNFAKSFFYTLWSDVPSSPSLPPLANVFGIAADVLEASGVDKLLQFANTDIPQVNPDNDYLSILNKINSDNSTFYWNNQVINNPYATLTPSSYIFSNMSYVHVNDGNNGFSTLAYDSNYLTCKFTCCEYLSIYIFSENDTYYYSLSSSDIHQVIPFSDGDNVVGRQTSVYNIFKKNIDTPGELIELNYWWNLNTYPLKNTYSASGSISDVLNDIDINFRNVNIYVNGVPWSIVNITPNNPIASTDLTYPNYEPAKYNYPDDTFVDWNRLYTIIYNAVRDGIVIDFGDLEDCFVDVNGQTAIATLGLVRNDYDNLVDEQFNIVPYPRFNNNLWLTNLAEEMTEPAQNGVAIIENAYNIFPIPLQKALLFAGALLLFGLLIRRFLE